VGLYYYKARFYSPYLGRFLQTDPIGTADNMNMYAYTNSDPLNGVDSTGLSCTSAGNSTTCYIPGSDMWFTVPRPKDWPALIDSSVNFRDHIYDVRTTPRSGTASDVGAINNVLARNPTPRYGNNPATAQGTPNNAQPYTNLTSDPVLSYRLPVQGGAKGAEIIVNVTQPGHALYPGYVARYVYSDPSGNVVLRTVGEGASLLQTFGAQSTGEQVWRQQSEAIVNKGITYGGSSQGKPNCPQ
jgi:uncharacterized protein RhaS with RHS repeats